MTYWLQKDYKKGLQKTDLHNDHTKRLQKKTTKNSLTDYKKLKDYKKDYKKSTQTLLGLCSDLDH